MKIKTDYYFGPYSITFFKDSIFEFWSYNIWNPKDLNSEFYGRNAGFTICPFDSFFDRFYYQNKGMGFENRRFQFGIGFFEFFIDYYSETER